MGTKKRTIKIACVMGAMAVVGGCASIAGEEWSSRDRGGREISMTVVGTGDLNNTGSRFDVDFDAADLREASMKVIRQAVNSPIPELRAHAIQALHHAPEHEREPAVLAGLADDNRGVRFIATMTVGRFQMCHLSHLVRPLLTDESESVRAAAIYTLDRCDQDVDINPLAEMIVSTSPEVKANAALVLGELGNPTAIPMLRRAAGRGMSRVHETHAQIVDLQIAEAIVKLGEERDLDVIRAALFAPGERAEVIALACLICGRLDDSRAVPNLENLSLREGRYRMPPEVRMAATLALAQINTGRPRIEVPLAYATSHRPELRMQAALTLGSIRSTSSVNALRQLLADSSPLVQVAAAAGVLQQLDQN